MTTQTFAATEDELELATRILVTRGCINDTSSDADTDANDTGGQLQGDQAKEVFNRSALPFATLRVIWNMSSEKGNGVLEKHEIAKALRLIGWAQAGEILSEKLLAVVGPLPTLDGITNDKEFQPAFATSRKAGSPQIEAFPAVNEDQVRECRVAFWEAGPVNGFLSEDKIMNAYMTSDLSYEDIRDIINLIDRSKRRLVDFPEFACGLYLVKALQDSQLHSLPSTIPPDLFDQFMTDPSSTTTTTMASQQIDPSPAYRRQPSSSSLSPPTPSSIGARHRHSYFALSPHHQQPSLRLSKPRMSSPGPRQQHHQPSSSSTMTTTTTTVTDVQNNNSSSVWEEISQHDRSMFELYFRKLDGNNLGYLDREAFDEFVSVYRLPAADLDQIWGLTTLEREGFMKREEFTIAMHLVKQRSAGHEIPTSLPLSIIPPSLKSRRNTIAFSSSSSSSSSPTPSSLTQKILNKKPPPPVPPKRVGESLTKAAAMSSSSSLSPPPLKSSLSISPPVSPRSNPFRQTMSFSAGSLSRPPPPPPVPSPLEKSPFEDPDHSRSLHMNGIPHPQSPPLSLPPPPPPPQLPTPPPAATATATAIYPERESESATRSKDEISRLSRQIEVLLAQLEAQHGLRASSDALRLENDILKTQVKETERMMADVLSVNETESAGSQEKYTQDITRLVGELEEKRAQCEEQARMLRALGEDEKGMRVKMRELEGTVARCVGEAAEYRQTIESQKQQIEELNARVGDMSKVLADEPESNRRGGHTASNRELRVLIRDVTRENDVLKSEKRDMERSMEQLLLSTKHGKYDAMELENRKLRKSVGELEIVVTQLQTSVGVSAGSSNSNNNNNNGHRRGRDSAGSENEQLKTQLQDGKRQFAEFRETSEVRMGDLQRKVEELTRENNRLKVDIHHASEGIRREDGSAPPPAYDDTFVPAG